MMRKEQKVKIVTWNVAGLNAIIKKGFFEYIKKENPDILCIQEHKLQNDKIINHFLPGYEQFFSCAEKKGYSGTAIFSKIKPIHWIKGMGKKDHDDEGRLVTAEFENFFLINTYQPNSGIKLIDLPYRQEWDKEFLEYLKKLDKIKPIIWCGDMNVAHQEIDLANAEINRNKKAGFTDIEREAFSHILDSGFIDVYRYLNPDKKGAYTYWTYFRNSRERNVGWRLDYFIISERLLKISKVNCMIKSEIKGSDHCPVVLLIDF